MFSRLAGNTHAKDVLSRLITKRRVPNSMIFAGEEGIGKRQFALEIARSLICLDAVSGEGCSVCSTCIRIGAFTLPPSDDKDAYKRVIWSEHPDVGMVSAHNRSIFVDAIRHLESEANFRPYEAPARIFIIDGAEKMNDAASNALLKTLEEPPLDSHIFLITSRPDSLLPTIRSRCQMIRFAPLEVDQIERFLIDEKAFTTDEARRASRLCRGSIGRALAMDAERFISARDEMLTVLRSVIEIGGLAGALKIAEQMNDAKHKDYYEETLDILGSLIHDVWRIRTSGDASRAVNDDMADVLTRLAEGAAAPRLASWLDEIETLRQNLIVNINRKVATDALFVKMASA
jgi:DNA polymerase III subunit delta'